LGPPPSAGGRGRLCGLALAGRALIPARRNPWRLPLPEDRGQGPKRPCPCHPFSSPARPPSAIRFRYSPFAALLRPPESCSRPSSCRCASLPPPPSSGSRRSGGVSGGRVRGRRYTGNGPHPHPLPSGEGVGSKSNRITPRSTLAAFPAAVYRVLPAITTFGGSREAKQARRIAPACSGFNRIQPDSTPAARRR
jgi:hypothetical protein